MTATRGFGLTVSRMLHSLKEFSLMAEIFENGLALWVSRLGRAAKA
jgi:hypothetical protein